MQDLISAAILIATLFSGTVVAGKIHRTVRDAALTKTAHGLPSLHRFAIGLTRHTRGPRGSDNGEIVNTGLPRKKERPVDRHN